MPPPNWVRQKKKGLSIMNTKSGLFDLTKGQDLAFWRRLQKVGVTISNIENFLSSEKCAEEVAKAFQAASPEISITQAKKILGKNNVLGPAEIKKAFGIVLPEDSIPPILFSRERLKQAKKLNQFLDLRIDMLLNNQQATMYNLYKFCQPIFDKLKAGKILYGALGDIWYSKKDRMEDFFFKKTPRIGWYLVTKDVIEESLNKNYLMQTEELIYYLTTKVFVNQKLPKIYQDAVSEFDETKDFIKSLMSNDWRRADKKLSELKINILCRRTPVEFLYDFLLYFLNNNERLLENRYDWTACLESGDELVLLGAGDVGGVGVSMYWSGSSSGEDGVCLSDAVSENLFFE